MWYGHLPAGMEFSLPFAIDKTILAAQASVADRGGDVVG